MEQKDGEVQGCMSKVTRVGQLKTKKHARHNSHVQNKIMLHNTHADEFGSTIFVGTCRKISFTTLTHKNKRVKSRLLWYLIVFGDPLSNNLFVASVFPKKETCFENGNSRGFQTS